MSKGLAELTGLDPCWHTSCMLVAVSIRSCHKGTRKRSADVRSGEREDGREGKFERRKEGARRVEDCQNCGQSGFFSLAVRSLNLPLPSHCIVCGKVSLYLMDLFPTPLCGRTPSSHTSLGCGGGPPARMTSRVRNITPTTPLRPLPPSACRPLVRNVNFLRE